MARIRSTFPGQWTDEDFVGCQPLARLLIIGLRNEADDQGVFEWKPVGLKMKLMPVDNVDMESLLADLETHRQIIKFTANGKVYGAIRNFVRFQRPKKPTKVHPLPPDLYDWVRMDMWGAKKKAGSESDADQHDDGSEPDGNETASGSEPASRSDRRRSEPTPTTKGVGSEPRHASTASSSELGKAQRTVSSEPKPSQRTRVPKSSEMAAQREEGGGNKEEERDSGIGESSAGGLRVRTRDEPSPPADGDDPGISQAVSAIRRSVTEAYERWFDLPDRPLTPADEELLADWIDAGTERGLKPAEAADAAAAEVQRQFRRLADRDSGPPRSLRAVLDADVRSAIANARPGRGSTGGGSRLPEPPAPYAGHLTALEFSSWIAPCRVAECDGVVTVEAPTRYVHDWIVANLTDKLRTAWGAQSVEVSVVAKLAQAGGAR